MKILIIVKSKHRDNTLKIAEAMSEVAPVTVVSLADASAYKIEDYDIVGFGSGIYYGKHDKELFEYIEKINFCNRKCFVFSTSGSKNFDKNNSALVKLLQSKQNEVLGTFGCTGLDKFFIFALFGGMNKTHPDMQDFENAQKFITDIVNKAV